MSYSASSIAGLTSIVVPCFNQRHFTRLCLRSVFQHTRPAWELIVVDNGSTDDTAAYLAGVQDTAAVPVAVIRNDRNRGFPAAINQGLEVARGEFLVLLNNDAVVTDGWLDQLIALSRARVSSTEETGESGERKAENGERRAERGERKTEEPGGERMDDGCVSGLGIGLVGPMSNYAPPPQLVENVPYRDLDEMHAFARRWRDVHRGKWFTAAKLSGFCLLMKRAVYEAIGGLDERFGLGFFDEDDLAERARRAGFAPAVAQDLFIHHFGSRTFAAHGIDAESLLEENARRFADKWGRDVPAGRRVMLRPWGSRTPPQIDEQGGEESCPQRDAAGRRWEDRIRATPSRTRNRQAHQAGSAARGTPENGALSAPPGSTDPSDHLRPSASFCGQDSSCRLGAGRCARVSLTMIVKDEQKNLPNCLGSVRGLFEEVVVVDTGSTDRTKEIARAFGARVFEFPWVDDFAAARNAALAHATGDYAFWLDADDVLDPPEREKLRALLDRLGTAPPSSEGSAARTEPRPPGEQVSSAYVVRCACDPGPGHVGGTTVVDHIRLFPLRDDVRWTYRVHEQILPSLRQAGIPVRWTDIVVRHTGYTDPTLRSRKLDRDVRILRAELAERPDDPFILFNMGAIAVEREEWPAALDHLNRSLAGTGPRDSIRRKLHALIARAHQMVGDPDAALRTCAEGLDIDPEDAELWFRKAVLHRQRRESAQAAACWRRILTLRRPEQFCSVDQGIYGHLTRRNLAALALEAGDQEEAARLWSEVLVECPADPEAMAHLRRLAPGHPLPAGPRPDGVRSLR